MSRFIKKIKQIYRENVVGYARNNAFPQAVYKYLTIMCSGEAYLAGIKPFFITVEDINTLLDLFKYETIYEGVTPWGHTFEKSILDPETHEIIAEKTLRIPPNMKIVKAIFKILRFYEYEGGDEQEQWRNAISDLQTQQHLTFNLTISIHPIDFMTMSDNTYGWTSCMSWTNEGCYSNGTIEMLNSNIMAVAYLSTSNDYYNGTIPNKAWRSLVYIHKKILLVGKSYPYFNQELTFKVLNLTRKLVENNLHWHYRFINQSYGDMRCSDHNQHNSLYSYAKSTSKHIYITTELMYNDLAEDFDYTFYCCRNVVDHDIWISASGKMTCMFCGQLLGGRGYNTSGRQKICSNCNTLIHKEV